MKRIVLVVALVLAASLIYAGQKIEVVTGTIPVTLSLKDSTGFVSTGFNPIQISEMQNGAASLADFQWDRIIGVFYLANLTELSTDSCVEGYNDTVILRYTAGTGPYSYVFETDTGTLPATEYFVLSRDAWADPSKWVGGDSTSAYAYPNYAGDAHALDLDQLWITHYVSDTSGTSGRLSGDIQYWLKFIKDGE